MKLSFREQDKQQEKRSVNTTIEASTFLRDNSPEQALKKSFWERENKKWWSKISYKKKQTVSDSILNAISAKKNLNQSYKKEQKHVR